MKQSLFKGWTIHGLFLLLSVQVYASAGDLSFEKKWTTETSHFVREALNGMTIPFPSSYDEKVEKLIKRYMTRGSHSFEKMLGKSGYYFPIFEQALKDQGLPKELKYLPLVESRLFPKVESSAGAGGLWQFMPATARHYGLKMDDWIDERYDPYLASKAAATMLSELYQQFKDWKLVLAAYNCGPGRVRRAIKKAGTSDYDQLKYFLPAQTREYLNKHTATAFVMENHQILGLHPLAFDLAYQQTSVLKVYEWMSFQGISDSLDIDVAELERLNPSYKKGIIPKNPLGNLLIIPTDIALAFEQFLKEKGIESMTYLRGEPVRVEPEPTTEYWASAYVKPLPSKVVFQFNLQGLLSWTHLWGRSLFGSLRLGDFLTSQLQF